MNRYHFSARLRGRFLLAMGVGALMSAACDKPTKVTPPPEPQPRATCVGAGVPEGQPTAPQPFHQCAAEHQEHGCHGQPMTAAFNETETRMARQRDANICCYDRVVVGPCPEPQHYRGRAFRVSATAPASYAQVDVRQDWALPTPVRQGPPEVLERLARAWLEDARAEHASVAAFSLLALQLMQHGAPADLLRATHLAALDEVRHAELCFAFASAYGERTVGPGAFDIGESVIATSLTELAVGTLVDGCFGETVAALEAHEAAKSTSDDAVRSALEQIAEDESRHAELGWRIVAWAVRVGGDDVLGAVEQAAGKLTPTVARHDDSGLEAYGRLGNDTLTAISAQCLRDVVMPCVAALREV